jgi:hypothetical protein
MDFHGLMGLFDLKKVRSTAPGPMFYETRSLFDSFGNVNWIRFYERGFLFLSFPFGWRCNLFREKMKTFVERGFRLAIRMSRSVPVRHYRKLIIIKWKVLFGS